MAGSDISDLDTPIQQRFATRSGTYLARAQECRIWPAKILAPPGGLEPAGL